MCSGSANVRIEVRASFTSASMINRLCRSIGFFFQAEDGIRDLTVTGVQTCALPIYRAVAGRRAVVSDEHYRQRGTRAAAQSRKRRPRRLQCLDRTALGLAAVGARP